MNESTVPVTGATSSGVLPGVGRALVASGQIDLLSVQKAYQRAIKNRKSLVSELVESGTMSALTLAQTVCAAFSTPLLDLDAVNIASLPDKLIDEKICQEYLLLCLGKRNHALVIATADPSNQEAEEKIKFITQRSVEWVVVEYDKLLRALKAKGAPTAETIDSEFIEDDFQDGELVELPRC